MSREQKLELIVQKLAYPERFAADYDRWFHGDGPFESYCDVLQEEAKLVLEDKSNE